MAEQTHDVSPQSVTHSASLAVGVCAWIGLLALAAPMALARSLNSQLDLYAALVLFFSLWVAYGGVFLGFLEARRDHYRGLLVSLAALAAAFMEGAIIAVNFTGHDFVSGAFVLLPMSLGCLAAPLAVKSAQRHWMPPALALPVLWLAPSAGLIALSILLNSWETTWWLFVATEHVQLGPWLRPIAWAAMPYFPSIPGATPEWRFEYWVDLPVAVVTTAALSGLIVVFIVRPRLRPALLVPFASLAALWVAMGILQTIPWFSVSHNGA